MTDSSVTSERVPRKEHWVDHYLPSIESDLRAPTNHFDQQRAVSDALKRAEQRTKDFSIALKEYEWLLHDINLPAGFELTGSTGWADVMEIVRQAEERYFEDAGISRRIVRAVGDYGTGTQLWAALLPNDSYMSVLSGSLKLILAAAIRRSGDREKILQSFRSVPDNVSRTEDTLDYFRHDQQLRIYALNVYSTLLDLIEGLIDSLIGESFWRRVKNGSLGERKTFSREHSKQSISQRITRFEDSVNSLNSRVDSLRTAKIAETASTARRIEKVVESTNVHVTEMEPSMSHTGSLTAKIYSRTRDIHDQGRVMESQLRYMGDEIEAVRTTHGWILTTQDEILRNMREILQEYLQNNEWKRAAEEHRLEANRLRLENLELMRSRTPSEAPQGIVKDWLWEVLGVNPDSASIDAQFMLRKGQGLDGTAYAQVSTLYRNWHYREFLTSNTSASLFVEAPSEEYALARCSPMSLACALLLEATVQQPYASTIHFFCGAHNTMADPMRGGNGMVRSLISQILRLQDFDFGFVDVHWKASLEEHELDYLCRLLLNLVDQLSVPALFCIIDGISLFEQPKWRDETMTVITELQRLVADSGLNVAFKLLVTSPRRSRDISQAFETHDRSHVLRLRAAHDDADVSLRALRATVGQVTLVS